MRSVWFLLLWSGCDRVFGLHDPKHDASLVVPIDVPTLDDAHAPADLVGCADGSRDVADDGAQIAGCSGAWETAGIPGTGSDSASSLCSPNGWHVCAGQDEATAKGAALLCAAVVAREFYATAQGSMAMDVCDNLGADDVFGCGNSIGSIVAGCGALNTSIGTFASQLDLGQWVVGNDGTHERDNVHKGDENGGVMCCRDD